MTTTTIPHADGSKTVITQPPGGDYYIVEVLPDGTQVERGQIGSDVPWQSVVDEFNRGDSEGIVTSDQDSSTYGTPESATLPATPQPEASFDPPSNSEDQTDTDPVPETSAVSEPQQDSDPSQQFAPEPEPQTNVDPEPPMEQESVPQDNSMPEPESEPQSDPAPEPQFAPIPESGDDGASTDDPA